MASHGISVALLRPLADLLARCDADPAAFLATVGVDAAMPPNTYIPGARVDAALAAIADARADPAFALALARASAARPIGLFGHMVWLSGSVRDALERAVKYYAAITQRTALELVVTPARAAIAQRPVDRTEVRGRILTELPFASLALRARDATHGAFRLRAVRFTHAGTPTPAYAEHFGAPVTFGAALDELELDPALLDLPLATAEPLIAQTLEARVEQLARDPFVERVRVAILADPDPDLESIAARLAISARTLRRHLEQHGRTLRELVDEVRRARADELLATGASIKEVAFALGFSEPSAFSRAYKRWTGAAPSARS